MSAVWVAEAIFLPLEKFIVFVNKKKQTRKTVNFSEGKQITFASHTAVILEYFSDAIDSPPNVL